MISRRRYSSSCGCSGALLVQTLVQTKVPLDVDTVRVMVMQTVYSVDGWRSVIRCWRAVPGRETLTVDVLPWTTAWVTVKPVTSLVSPVTAHSSKQTESDKLNAYTTSTIRHLIYRHSYMRHFTCKLSGVVKIIHFYHFFLFRPILPEYVDNEKQQINGYDLWVLHAVWSAIGMILLSVRLSVTLRNVALRVCMGWKVVPRTSTSSHIFAAGCIV